MGVYRNLRAFTNSLLDVRNLESHLDTAIQYCVVSFRCRGTAAFNLRRTDSGQDDLLNSSAIVAIDIVQVLALSLDYRCFSFLLRHRMKFHFPLLLFSFSYLFSLKD